MTAPEGVPDVTTSGLVKFVTGRVEKISIHRQMNAYDDASRSQVKAKDRYEKFWHPSGVQPN